MFQRVFLLLSVLINAGSLTAQTAPFDIFIEPLTGTQLGGLQSFAYGQWGGKWLIIGGRLDGLHRRQPFAAFDVAGNNSQLIVYDPVVDQKWTAPLSALPVGMQEQLSSTNMEFHQEGSYLYLIGGYGYNSSSASRITFSYLTAVDVPGVINAIINNNPYSNYFRQISDPQFGVTGGHLKKINDTYYLLCGNKFDGDYNPMGNNTYTQVYTNAVRKFNMADDGINISITHLPSIVDATNLHRRDYNAVPQILTNGSEGITVFSGVFQPTVDLPHLTSVDVDSIGYTVNSGFQQYYNHYHCATLPLYSAAANEMHSVFFGGIAQYYDNGGTLVQDNNVPFVKTITRVTRTANNTLGEYKLPVEMPALLGAGSEFIHLENLPEYGNGVIKLDDLTGDTTLVGYIYGGISSTAPNIFMSNTGSQSAASSQVFRVYVVKNSTSAGHYLNKQSMSGLALQVYPNPAQGSLGVIFHLAAPVEVKLTIHDLAGRVLEERMISKVRAGENNYVLETERLIGHGVVFLSIETPAERASQKIVLSR